MKQKTKFFASIPFWGFFIGLSLYIGFIFELIYLRKTISKIFQNSITKYNRPSYLIFQFTVIGLILLITLAINILMFIYTF